VEAEETLQMLRLLLRREEILLRLGLEEILLRLKLIRQALGMVRRLAVRTLESRGLEGCHLLLLLVLLDTLHLLLLLWELKALLLLRELKALLLLRDLKTLLLRLELTTLLLRLVSEAVLSLWLLKETRRLVLRPLMEQRGPDRLPRRQV
jgi:hypothetical protein